MSVVYNRYWKENNFDTLWDFPYKWPAINKFIPKHQKITILDYGCGPGTLISAMKEINPTAHYIGMDVSDQAIKEARKKHLYDKFYVVADGQKLPLQDSSVDFILAADVIEHVYDTKLIFQEFYRILKPGGKILMTTPYHGLIKNLVISLFAFEKIFDPLKNHIRFYTKKSLFKVFNLYNFKIDVCGYFGRFYPLSRAIYILAHKS